MIAAQAVQAMLIRAPVSLRQESSAGPERAYATPPLSLPLHRGLDLSYVQIVAEEACLLHWRQRHESLQVAWLLLGPWLLLP